MNLLQCMQYLTGSTLMRNNRDAWDYSEDSSKNRPLYSLRELRLIEGFSPEDLSDLTESDETNLEEVGNSGKTDRFDSHNRKSNRFCCQMMGRSI